MKNELAPIEDAILAIRGQKVILSPDLATIYGVPTKALNQAVRRNIEKFPSDFLFQLTRDEAAQWHRSRFQSATLKRGHHLKYLPYAFTEHGAIMAANILNSPRAVQMSVFVVRAFVKMREMLLSHRDMAAKLRKLEKRLTERLDVHETAIVEVLREVMLLLNPPDDPQPPREPIGFRVKERRATYQPTPQRGHRPGRCV